MNYNDLTGPIPKEIGDLTNLRDLYLNNNNFNGRIPKSIGKENLTDILILRLDNNQLIGEIPPSMRGYYSSFDVSNNFLSGVIPSGIETDYCYDEEKILIMNLPTIIITFVLHILV